jgi:hypothetical protein
MKITTIAVAALSLGLLAACGKNDRPAGTGSSAAPRNEAATVLAGHARQRGRASASEKRDGKNPVQGQGRFPRNPPSTRISRTSK